MPCTYMVEMTASKGLDDTFSTKDIYNIKSLSTASMRLFTKAPRGSGGVYRLYTLRYTSDKLRSTVIHLTIHPSHRCARVVPHLSPVELLGSLSPPPPDYRHTDIHWTGDSELLLQT